jgi:hypothetical protein
LLFPGLSSRFFSHFFAYTRKKGQDRREEKLKQDKNAPGYNQFAAYLNRGNFTVVKRYFNPERVIVECNYIHERL